MISNMIWTNNLSNLLNQVSPNRKGINNNIFIRYRIKVCMTFMEQLMFLRVNLVWIYKVKDSMGKRLV